MTITVSEFPEAIKETEGAWGSLARKLERLSALRKMAREPGFLRRKILTTARLAT